MKHCPQCKKPYDASFNFCLDDGSELTFFDTEAETLKTVRKPEMSSQDIRMEIANILRSTVAGGETLIRFDLHTAIGATTEQISENFAAAAEEAGFEVLSKSDTRATVRRKLPEITFRHSAFDID